MNRIASTSLFTPNADKLSLFCLADLPGVLRYDYEEEEYQEELKRALQEAVPFEDQDEIEEVLHQYLTIKGEFKCEQHYEDWQPREGDNWKVPEGLKWEIVELWSLKGTDDWYGVDDDRWQLHHPEDEDYKMVVRLKAAEPKSVEVPVEWDKNSGPLSGLKGTVTLVASRDAESQESLRSEIVRKMSKEIEGLRLEGATCITEFQCTLLEELSNYHITRK